MLKKDNGLYNLGHQGVNGIDDFIPVNAEIHCALCKKPFFITFENRIKFVADLTKATKFISFENLVKDLVLIKRKFNA